jgi:hypothetical protein
MFALNLGPYRKSGRLDDGEVVIRSAAAYEKTSRICFANGQICSRCRATFKFASNIRASRLVTLVLW